jgi:hypothetical protein
MEPLIMMITTIVVALITAVFGPIALEWAKAYFQTKPKKSPIQEALETNTLVSDQLDIILNYLNCDRVWVAQFHNGGHFYPTGKSIQKFSVFYETTTPGTTPLHPDFQNVPCSAFPKALAEVYSKGEVAIPNYNEGENYDLKGISQKYGSQSTYLVGLYSLDNHLIGVMTISYNKKPHTLTKDEWIYLRQKVGVVGTLLSDYLKCRK